MLPKKIDLDSAIKQWGNVASLTYGFSSKNIDLIKKSMKDYIIEPVRSKLIPAYDDIKGKALDNGAIGCSISGSGPSIFAFTMNKVPELVDNILDKNKLNKSDITYYLLHQANAYMLNNLRKKLGIEASRFIIRVKETGNTVSTSIPLVLEDLMPSCKKGDRILIAGFGVGYSWGGTVITI